MNGTIKNVIEKKQFGFIRGEGGVEYFFHREDFQGHWDDLTEDVNKGAEKIRVEFEAFDTPKGPRASEVRRCDFPNSGR